MNIEYIDSHKARLIVSVGSRENRKRYTRTIQYKGKKDAERQYKEFEAEVKGGVETTMSVDELLSYYIELKKLAGARQTTIEQAYQPARHQLASYFKGRKAAQVSTYLVERYIASQVKIRSPKTIKNEISLLSASYTLAIRQGLLKENPCANATLPKIGKPEIDTLDSETYGRFVDGIRTCDNIDFRVALEFALFCGLRCSEIMALTEDDIDAERQTVSINKSRHRNSVQAPKSKSSYRTLALPKFMADDIKELSDKHAHAIQSSEWLIQNQFGEPITHNWLQRHLAKFLQQNALPHITMHGLRHTHASYLISHGLEVAEVSHQLGHAQQSTTLNVYSHLFDDATTASRRIAEMFENEPQMSHTSENEKTV